MVLGPGDETHFNDGDVEWDLRYDFPGGPVPPGEYQVTARVECSNPIYSAPINIIIGENQQTIQLYAGWNFVSLYLDPISADPYTVFGSIWYACNFICTYDAASGAWLYYKFNEPGFPNTLTDVDLDRGYWVNMAYDATLEIFGNPLEDTGIELVPGCNVVAFKSAELLSLEDALLIEYESIWTFNNLTGEWWWNVPSGPTPPNDLTELVPGNAYCIYVNDGCTWEIGSP